MSEQPPPAPRAARTWRARRGAVARPRAVVSIGFSVEEFDLVDRAAEARGVYTSAFVREAAIRAARRELARTETTS